MGLRLVVIALLGLVCSVQQVRADEFGRRATSEHPPDGRWAEYLGSRVQACHALHCTAWTAAHLGLQAQPQSPAASYIHEELHMSSFLDSEAEPGPWKVC